MDDALFELTRVHEVNERRGADAGRERDVANAAKWTSRSTWCLLGIRLRVRCAWRTVRGRAGQPPRARGSLYSGLPAHPSVGIKS